MNADQKTVEGFGREWRVFTQETLSDAERAEHFNGYFSLIDWTRNYENALDMGCGSGRWSVLVAPRVGHLVCADISPEALAVAKQHVLAPNALFVEASPETLPFPDAHFDLIFSLGVLHHVPDTASAIKDLAAKLTPGGTMLLYLYYAFDNRPLWFRALWQVSDAGRQIICRLPFWLKYLLSQVIATVVYWPLARIARHFPVPDSWPLKIYAPRSFYSMRTDALDRFGTRLEQRFTRQQITDMLAAAGLVEVRFSDTMPFWVCVATKTAAR